MSEIFDPRTAKVLGWVVGVSLALSLGFRIFRGPEDVVDAHGADTYSTSAVGFAALASFLEPEVPVLISGGHSAARAAPERPLLLLAPRSDAPGLERLRELVATALDRGAPVVVVLPKWRVRADPGRPEWVAEVALLPVERPGRVLATALVAAGAADGIGEVGVEGVFRPGGEEPFWAVTLDLDAAVPAPSIPERQLIRDRDGRLTPLVADGEGILVARVEGTPLHLVADPDLLNTAGLARGDNAVLVHRFLIGELAPAALVVDETIHGYRRAGSVWRALLELPLLPFTLQLALLAALVAWAGAGRFGAAETPPPRVAPGKRSLVDNTVRLLGLGGHHGPVLDRYFRLTAGRAAERLHSPGGGGFRAQVAALARLGHRRGATDDLEELGREVHRFQAGGGRAGDPRRALRLARRLYRWRKEISDG